MMDVRFRPVSSWPGDRTPPLDRKSRWSFKAGWNDTLNLLDRELRHLHARNVVIEAHLREGDIRIDGWPRADARTPSDPGVVVSFDSSFGPLRYATDVFEYWQHNVRAIALGLEALRKVDRYGITRRGEQYTGWKALPPGIALGPASFTSEDEALAFLIEHGEWGDIDATVDELRDAPDSQLSYYREAAKKLHPDNGGDHDLFVRLQQAWEYLNRTA